MKNDKLNEFSSIKKNLAYSTIFALIAWWLFSTPYKDYSPISALFALLIPTLNNGFRCLNKSIKNQEKYYSILKPEVIASYLQATSADATIDHSLSRVAKQLIEELQPSFDALNNVETEKNDAFFNILKRRMAGLKEGHRILAICGRKFWDDASKELVESYWDLNLQMAHKKVLVRRIFVADGGRGEREYSDELTHAIHKHRQFISELKNVNNEEPTFDFSGRLKIKLLNASERDALKEQSWLDPKLGFALISRGEEKIVALHRLVDGDLQGTIISNPLIYSIFEQYFWIVWNRSGISE